MKKFCLCIIFIILIISCNPDARKDNQGYLVESNITAIGGNGRAIAGDEIVGVLLRYDYTDESVFFLEFNENGELKQNGDGMKYNYVSSISHLISELCMKKQEDVILIPGILSGGICPGFSI